MIQKGANINDKTKYEFFPIHLASCNENIEILKYIVSLDKNVDYIDELGEKAIHCACEYNLIENIKYLLSIGANINEKNKEGKTGLDYLDDETKKILKDLNLI